MRPVNHTLTAPAHDFQQFVITQICQCLDSVGCFLTLPSGSYSISFNVFSRATVIRLRRGYGGRVASGYLSVREQTKTILEKTTWAALFPARRRGFPTHTFGKVSVR
jgi:hypothetical protein